MSLLIINKQNKNYKYSFVLLIYSLYIYFVIETKQSTSSTETLKQSAFIQRWNHLHSNSFSTWPHTLLSHVASTQVSSCVIVLDQDGIINRYMQDGHASGKSLLETEGELLFCPQNTQNSDRLAQPWKPQQIKHNTHCIQCHTEQYMMDFTVLIMLSDTAPGQRR